MEVSPEQQTSINYLIKLFAESTEVTPADIWRNTGRENKSFKSNMHWLYNVLVRLSRENYISKVYDGRKLKRIKLTQAGKEALGLPSSSSEQQQIVKEVDTIIGDTSDNVTFETVTRDVQTLRDRHKGLNIIFKVELEEEMKLDSKR